VALEDHYRWRDFVMRFQQLTGPVMAKGLEDTAFYIYNRLVSLNEVGGEPERFGLPVAAFHKANAQRQRDWPASLLATSTHDTKRSEDVRARIGVLSELPEEWRAALEDLRPLAQPFKTELDDERRAPDANEEFLFYQTVLGTWPQGPLEGTLNDRYVDRIVDYMHKATKEAKVNTSWVDASPEYDAAIEGFVRKALDRDSPVRARLEPLAREVAWFGRWSSLSQTLLKLTSPGVPDTYQGNETWDFSLVDPDNRRPVDYRVRREMLKEIREGRARGSVRFLRELVTHPEDGRIKMFVTHVALETRRRFPEVFGAAGQYVPMEGQGLRACHVVAFARVLNDAEVIVIAPRLSARLVNRKPIPPLGPCWEDTAVLVEEGTFRNLLTGEELSTDDRDSLPCLRLDAVLRSFPLAILERQSRSRRRELAP
jgi:(1->4)-alpha-D-glucan 1-alpha-D-glucosylmutase